MPPFQNEGPELSVGGSRNRQPSHKPFGDEGEEIARRLSAKRKLKSELKPFQEEAAESGSSSEPEYLPSSPPQSIFSLGWQTVHGFQQATAWQRSQEAEKREKQDEKKRIYNNTRRIAKAKASGNFGKHGRKVFETKGMDTERVKALTSQDCKCA